MNEPIAKPAPTTRAVTSRHPSTGKKMATFCETLAESRRVRIVPLHSLRFAKKVRRDREHWEHSEVMFPGVGRGSAPRNRRGRGNESPLPAGQG